MKLKYSEIQNFLSIDGAQKVLDFGVFQILDFGIRDAQSVQIFQNLKNSKVWNTLVLGIFG